MVEIAENIRRRIVANIRSAVIKLYRVTVWGHLIYQPIEKSEWKIPKGMTTLEEFLNWHREKGIEQARRDHPLALESFLSFTLDHEPTAKEIGMLSSLLGEALFDDMFSGELIDMMEWGYEIEKVTETEKGEAGWRVSRNGEYFTEKNIMEKKWFRDKWRELGYEV